MFRINQLLGMAVINQTTGERLASVDNIVFSEDSRVAIALLLKGSGIFAKPQVVRWGAVQSIADVVVINATEPPRPLGEDAMIANLYKLNNRISGLPLIGAGGQRVGTLRDIFIDMQGKVLGYEVDPGGLLASHKFLPTAQVQTVGKDAVIASDTTMQKLKDAQAEAKT